MSLRNKRIGYSQPHAKQTSISAKGDRKKSGQKQPVRTAAPMTGSSWTTYSIGRLLFERAEFNYHKLFEFKPDYERAYYNFETIVMKRNNYNEAIRYYEKALQINPGYEQARQSLEHAEKRK
jgi:tetratricopeptide (TPR) repeat protein